MERALASEQRALALDNSLPWAYSLLAEIYGLKQEHEQAIAEGERAIALDPNNDISYAVQAEALNCAGRPEEALRAVEHAMRLNPRYPSWYLMELGWADELTGRYAEAIATTKEFISRNPDFRLPTISWLPPTCSSGPRNRAPLARRWSRRWRRCDEPWL